MTRSAGAKGVPFYFRIDARLTVRCLVLECVDQRHRRRGDEQRQVVVREKDAISEIRVDVSYKRWGLVATHAHQHEAVRAGREKSIIAFNMYSGSALYTSTSLPETE